MLEEIGEQHFEVIEFHHKHFEIPTIPRQHQKHSTSMLASPYSMYTFEHTEYIMIRNYIYTYSYTSWEINLVIALSESPQRFNARRWGDGDAKAELIA